MGIKMSGAFPSKFLKAADLQDKQVQLVIDRVEMDEAEKGKQKPVVYFQNTSRGFMLNVTNANKIVSAYGDDSDDWVGKPIILYPTEVDFKGEQVEAIRVKIPKEPLRGGKAPQAAKKGAKEATEDELSDEIPF